MVFTTSLLLLLTSSFANAIIDPPYGSCTLSIDILLAECVTVDDSDDIVLYRRRYM